MIYERVNILKDYFVRIYMIKIKPTMLMIKKKRTEGLLIQITFILHQASVLISYISITLLALLFVSFIILVSPLITIRFISINSVRMGLFVFSPELMLLKYKYDFPKKRRIFIFYTAKTICNTQIYIMWKRAITIFPFPRLGSRINGVVSLILCKKQRDENQAVNALCSGSSLFTSDIFDMWDQRKYNAPHIFFTPQEIFNAKLLVQQLGVPVGARFVCLLVRDPKYLQSLDYNNNGYWQWNNFRDADIDNYSKAVLFLVEQGYYVIRMGKIVNKLFNIDHKNVIDYANHSLRSDLLDVYLAACCDFYVSTASGLDIVPVVFKRSVLITNYANIGDFYYEQVYQLVYLKKFIDANTGQLLTLSEVVAKITEFDPNNRHNDGRMNESFASVVFIENNEEEILSAVREMVLYRQQKLVLTEEDEILQQKFWSTYRDIALKYGCVEPKNITTIISPTFLRNNVSFLQ